MSESCQNTLWCLWEGACGFTLTGALFQQFYAIQRGGDDKQSTNRTTQQTNTVVTGEFDDQSPITTDKEHNTHFTQTDITLVTIIGQIVQ